MGVGAGQDNGLLHIHELICMMWWQMYPFPHTCPVGSVGGAGGVGQGGRCWGVPQGLGGPAVRVTQTLSLSLWISLSPHLTQSESHWFSICVVISRSHSVSIIFLSCPLAEPHSTWDLSSPATDGSRASCIGSAEFLTTGPPGRYLSHSVSFSSPVP